MVNTKLYSLLSCLAVNELNEFNRYLQNDSFCRKPVLRECLKILTAHFKGKISLPDRAVIAKKIFPKETHPSFSAKPEEMERKLDKVSSELKTHLDSYLLTKAHRSKTLQREMQLFDIYIERRSEVLFWDQYRKIDRLLDRDYKNDVNFDRYKFEICQKAYTFFNVAPFPHRHEQLVKSLVHLDQYYCATKLVDTWVTLMNELLLNHEPQLEGIQELLSLSDRPEFQDRILIRHYSAAIQQLIDDNINREDMMHVFDDLREKGPELTYKVGMGIFSLVSNQLSILISLKGRKLPRERYTIMRYGLENGYLYKGDTLSFINFSNLINGALEAGELDFAEELIEKYLDKLLPELREVTRAVSQARISFVRGEFREALRHLHSLQATASPVQKLLEKTLRIRCLYELMEDDLLENELEASRKFAQRNQELGPGFSRRLNEFVLVVRQLYHARLRKVVPEELIQRIEQEDLMYKDWLQEKKGELKT